MRDFGRTPRTQQQADRPQTWWRHGNHQLHQESSLRTHAHLPLPRCHAARHDGCSSPLSRACSLQQPPARSRRTAPRMDSDGGMLEHQFPLMRTLLHRCSAYPHRIHHDETDKIKVQIRSRQCACAGAWGDSTSIGKYKYIIMYHYPLTIRVSTSN
jgi:hypothetical protein